MKNELMRAHRLLCSRFVSEDLFRRSLGGPRADINAIIAYLNLPVDNRPAVSWFFDAGYYTLCNQDALAPGEDPLLHFLEVGLLERRSPHPLIDLRSILGEDSLILGDPPEVDGLVDLLDYDLARPGPYFDLDFYASQFGGPQGGELPQGGLLQHFLATGARTGRRPNAWLDPAWYLSRNPDAPADLYAAMRHFILVGDNEGRNPGPDFDSGLYRRRYTDVADSGMAPLLHYLAYGRKERRQGSAEKPLPQLGMPQSGGSAEALAAPRSRPVGRPLPVDAALCLAADADMRARLAAARQIRKDQVIVTPPVMLRAQNPGADLARLRFAAARKPRVSILIPVFNEFEITVECLMSLARENLGAGVEIVVADDASTDPDMAALGRVKNLVVVRHPENLGFLRSCNAAFARCRGAYVLLLNNDTQVLPGAIASLVAALDADPGVGAAGAKLLYPNGRLQEAGCFIRPNGETGMVGLFADPDEGGYSRDRDVTYCSGAALMIRRSAVGPVLFDEIYRPAYCEDVDLCLRLRDDGHRIRFVHAAHVVHHLSVSSNRDSIARKLRGIARNQHRLLDRWGPEIARMNAVRVLAFYLPQFHPTPENDLWWGQGFSEWTNVTRAQPSYAGHYQPHLPTDLGFYDLRLADTIRQQAELAARYGVEGFVFYYYNFGARRVLHRPLDVLRANPDIDVKFCLCWANENWTKHWDGGTREMLLEQSYETETLSSILDDIVAHAADPRAVTVAGLPVFMVYRPLKLPDPPAFAAACRAAFAKAGFAGVHLVYVESMEAVDAHVSPADLGFDACVEFPPHGRATPCSDSPEITKDGWAGYRYDYPETVLNFTARDSVAYARYPAVFPSWDNTARQPDYGSSFDRATPEAFRVYVEEKIEELRCFHTDDQRLLFVNAWNEWAEGAHLEPDAGYGHRWLEALRGALDSKSIA